ncbi:unnamed protein product [Psylliodes chrysocephalus]|uniref:Carboxylic ester hydrolase n=1 Tax=Psylliodes chrysocephalus TaxID=3402493 RepID=A0A9P0GAY5_9CUCU|nr:unnamed protein product [Psylliodes chrysocephala]
MGLLFYKCLILFTSCTLGVSQSQEILSNIVTLNHGGQIQGHLLKSQKQNVYYAFQEIPYATPPVGNFRFKEATEPVPWQGVKKTTKNTKICIQFPKNDPRETEDCLYLNVYTPQKPGSTQKLLPVYVFVHGGFLLKNDGTFELFGPQFLMDYGIVVVTLNYRLGPFGFISTEDDVLPGNLGIKDQILALQWIQKNIKLFGGDPKKVTLGGHSSGGSCVGHIILNKQSKGLFRSVIQESGSPLNSKMFMKHPRYFAFQLGQLINNNIDAKNSSQELLKVLLDASTEDIKKNSGLPIPENMRNAVGNQGNTVWNPVEEHSRNGVIKGLMHENFKNGIFNKVPMLIGVNSEEQLKFDLEELKTKTKYFDENAAYLINGNLNITEENKLPAGTKLKKIYTNTTFEEDFPAFIRFVSDASYTTGVYRQAELQSKYVDVFMYQFSYDGILGGINSSIPGVGHTEELNYLFQNKFNKNIDSFPTSDLKVQETILTLWTNFIKYLNPLPQNGAKWPKVTPNLLSYQNIKDTLQVATNPKVYKDIKKIYEEYAEEIQYTY